MDLPVAVGVQEDTVVHGILAPMRAPDHMMVVPSGESGDLLVANRTETVLMFPQVQQLPAAFEGVCHFHEIMPGCPTACGGEEWHPC